MKDDIAVQFTTTVNSLEEAEKIAQAVVEQKLAACAQVSGPITSHYRWRGEMCRDREWKVSVKTVKSLEKKLMALIEEIHPYETPELTAVRLESYSRSYHEWMLRNLQET